MTRTGKIARLPHQIREQLNPRLRDGHKAKSILPWLNALPEVQSVLQAEFDGHPITPGNLTEWKKGGYREWHASRQALQFFENLQDENGLGNKSLAGPVAAKLAHWAALHFAAIAHSIVSAENDPLIKLDRLRQLCIDIARLRRGDLHQERISLDRDWLALEQSNTAHQRELDFWKWTERPDIHQKLFPDREGGLSLETLEKIEKELKLM